MTLINILLQAPNGGNIGFQEILIIVIILIIILALKSSRKLEDTPVAADQTNKVVNVTLTGGIIGMFASSPQKKLNDAIKRENANGWRVVQIIPADSGNIFLIIYRSLLLLITLFLYTNANGYYVIMEKKL